MKLFSFVRDMLGNANVRKPIPPAGTPALKPLGSVPEKSGQMAAPPKVYQGEAITPHNRLNSIKLPPTIKAANEAINALPTFDKAAFFAILRNGPLRHRKPSQVMGTEAILAAMAGAPLAWTAYALATAWHETAFTMQPIKEKGGRAYFMRMYDKTGNRPHVAKELGNTVEGDGATFAGRGYVQLTGRRNYAKASTKLGIDLIGSPDLAMQPEHAARIMREGMTDAWFTGRGFVHFLPSDGPASLAQFTQARRIINGMDKAAKIAGEALAFQAALIAGGWE